MRIFGIVGMLGALVAAAVLATSQLGGSSGQPAIHSQIARAVFTGADDSLAAYRAGTGTYVGAPAFPGVTVVRADAASYCIQALQGSLVAHEQGPGGSVQPGPC